ncbi:MAG: hypothetical protein NPIRA04_35000 [Nitrospirales bacterium]|nr:MAG: hypothetical protein NPIRA04_35000 [Nitrospirales bacterium]
MRLSTNNIPIPLPQKHECEDLKSYEITIDASTLTEAEIEGLKRRRRNAQRRARATAAAAVSCRHGHAR